MLSTAQGCAYTSVLITPDGKSLVAAGSDNKIKELEETAVRLQHVQNVTNLMLMSNKFLEA